VLIRTVLKEKFTKKITKKNIRAYLPGLPRRKQNYQIVLMLPPANYWTSQVEQVNNNIKESQAVYGTSSRLLSMAVSISS
jgi:hypothetical protein